MGSRLARLVVKHPRAVLIAALLIGAALTPVVIRIRFDFDLTSMIPAGSAPAAAYARYSKRFATEQSLIAVVMCDDPAKLTGFADGFAEKLRQRPDVAEVRVKLSAQAAGLVRNHLIELLDDAEIDRLAPRLTDEALRAQAKRLRALLTAPGGGALAPLLGADPLELLPLVGARLQAGLPVDPTSGYFKSLDGKALLIMIRPRFAPSEFEKTRALFDGAEQIVADLGGRVPGDGVLSPPGPSPAVGYTGFYAYAIAYRDTTDRDVKLSTILSLVAVLLLFAILLGALRVIPLVAAPLLYGLWLTGAAAVLLYGRLSVVSFAFGPILISIGIDVPIQIYNRLREELDTHPPLAALERTIAALAGPALVATLGPSAVFFCCALSDYSGLAELGVLAGTGLILNLVAMLTVLPALLVLVPPRLWAPKRRARPTGQGFAWFGRVASRRPKLVLGAFFLVAAACAPLALKVSFERRLISMQPPGMAVVKVQREFEAHFGAQQQALLALSEDADPERALQASDGWRAVSERLRARGLVSSYQSISTLFPSQAEQARRRAHFQTLHPEKVAASFRTALGDLGFDLSPFESFLAQLEHPAPPLTLADAGPELSFLVHNTVHDDAGLRTVANFIFTSPEHLDEVLATLDQAAAADPHLGVVTGQPILEETLRRVVVRDTKRVTLASVCAVVLLLALFYRRPRPVLAVLLPLSGAWIFFCVALGALGLPLNLFNLLSVPLVVGYGIDDHVFLVHRHEEDPSHGPGRALASTGRAIVVTSLSTMAGFAGLAVARFDGLRSLGITGALAVALCLVAAMAVLPALLALLWPAKKESLPPQSVDGNE